MTTMKNFLRLLVALLAASVLGGCASMVATAPVDRPSYEKFKAASADERQQMVEQAIASAAVSDQFNRMSYVTGDKVCYENGSCAQWNKLSRTVAVWYAHSTGDMGMDTSAVTTFPTDEAGNVVNTKGAILAHAADQPGLGRWVGDKLTSIATGAVNGAIAAKIAKCEGDECGPSVVNVVSTASEANSQSNANVKAVAGSGGGKASGGRSMGGAVVQ